MRIGEGVTCWGFKSSKGDKERMSEEKVAIGIEEIGPRDPQAKAFYSWHCGGGRNPRQIIGELRAYHWGSMVPKKKRPRPKSTCTLTEQ